MPAQPRTGARTRITTSLLLALVAAVGLLGAVALAMDNPDVERGRHGESGHTCLAPWDTVFNDASNTPGGDPDPANDAAIAEACREAGRGRFRLAVGAGALGLVAWTGAVAVLLVRRRPRRPESAGASCSVGAEGIEPPTTSL